MSRKEKLKRKKSSIKTTFFLAYKNLIASKKTLVIITGVLALSFLSITFFAAIIDGLGYSFEEKSIQTLNGHLLIEPTNDETYIYNSENLIKKIRRLDGVEGVSPRISTSATMQVKDTILASQIYFINPTEEKTATIILDSTIEGTTLTKNDLNSIYIGTNLVEKYANIDDKTKKVDINAGDIIKLKFNNGYEGEFKIKGIYKTGSSFSDGYIFMNEKNYEKIYNISPTFASSILVRLPERGLEEEYIYKLREIGVSNEINPWYTKISKIKQFTASLQITNKITGLIGLLTTFATIYIIIFINVMTKRKQIGILKAIGIKKEIVLGSYVIQSLVYGILGVIAGLLVMKIMMLYFASHPLKMPIGDVYPVLDSVKISIACISIIISALLAGYFPSKKAAEENILDAIFGG